MKRAVENQVTFDKRLESAVREVAKRLDGLVKLVEANTCFFDQTKCDRVFAYLQNRLSADEQKVRLSMATPSDFDLKAPPCSPPLHGVVLGSVPSTQPAKPTIRAAPGPRIVGQKKTVEDDVDGVGFIDED